MYLGLAYVTYATQGFYVYSFLNPGKQHALLAGYIVGILIGCIVVYGVVNLVAMVLRRVTHVKGYEQWRTRYQARGEERGKE
jgi:hypothetical protein